MLTMSERVFNGCYSKRKSQNEEKRQNNGGTSWKKETCVGINEALRIMATDCNSRNSVTIYNVGDCERVLNMNILRISMKQTFSIHSHSIKHFVYYIYVGLNRYHFVRD